MPACLKPSPDGTIEGTPDKIGSFAVKLFFKSRSCSGSRDIVIRVAPSVASTARINSEAGVTSVNQFIVVNSNKALTYLVGDKIDFSLDARNGKAPYTWNFLNLPSQLTADRNGRISGVFSQEGYYSFSASANDGSGANADSYFTFNIQPKSVAKRNPFSTQNPSSLKFQTATCLLGMICSRSRPSNSQQKMPYSLPSRSSITDKMSLLLPDQPLPRLPSLFSSPLPRKTQLRPTPEKHLGTRTPQLLQSPGPTSCSRLPRRLSTYLGPTTRTLKT